MPTPLDRLKRGIRRFQSEIFVNRADAYREAVSRPQQPHTLIVGCADSRVDLETITSSGPGDVFITRNVGNLVPAFGETPGGVSAVIEYAVDALKVQHIVVCGHSDCGAMKALLNPAPVTSMPYVGKWLTHAYSALRVAEAMCADRPEQDLLTVLTEQNVLMQLAHLRTHPHVAGALARREMKISGWVYDIGSGEVRITEDSGGGFVAIRPDDSAQ